MINLKTLIPAALIALLAVPALADDQGNANAEQQNQPTPSRGGTAGGPGHGPGRPADATASDARSGAPSRDDKQHRH